MKKSEKTTEQTKIKSKPKPKSSTKTISEGYLEINDLVSKCWQKGSSFRLLAAILRTERYTTIYDTLVRGKAFPGIQRSRPSRAEQEDIAGIPLDILSVMEEHHITVRKWCRAYNIDCLDLWFRRNLEGTETSVVPLLKEDFPELFGLESPKYITVPVGCDLRKMFDPKKGRHVYWSYYYNIRVEHAQESEALRLFNWRKSQAVIKRRLQLLLEKGIAAALSWPPSELKTFNEKTGEKKWVLVPEPEEAARQQKIFEILTRDGEIKSLIRKLAALPSRNIYMSNDQVEQECRIRKELVKTYDVTPEQIDNEVKRLRLKEGRY